MSSAKRIKDSGAEFIIHVGRQKTGTSAIQAACSASPDRLAEVGLVYANGNRGQAIAHHGLAREISSKRPGPCMETLADEAERLAGKSRILISSEALQNVPAFELLRVFPQGRSTVLIWLRDQVEYLRSAYAQKVQATDFTDSPEEYVDRVLKNFGDNLNYKKVLDRYCREFGVEYVVPRIYDQAWLPEGGSVPDFSAVIGLDESLETLPGDANVSIGHELVLFKRHWNENGGGNIYAALARLQSEGVCSGPFVLEVQVVERIREKADPANAEMFATYFKGVAKGFSRVDRAEAAPPPTADDLQAMIESFRARVSPG